MKDTFVRLSRVEKYCAESVITLHDREKERSSVTPLYVIRYCNKVSQILDATAGRRSYTRYTIALRDNNMMKRDMCDYRTCDTSYRNNSNSATNLRNNMYTYTYIYLYIKICKNSLYKNSGEKRQLCKDT